MKNSSCVHSAYFERVRMEEYVKGAEPDRWHWCKNCTQYPRVVIKKRAIRPNSDLCDQCAAREKKQECVM